MKTFTTVLADDHSSVSCRRSNHFNIVSVAEKNLNATGTGVLLSTRATISFAPSLSFSIATSMPFVVKHGRYGRLYPSLAD